MLIYLASPFSHKDELIMKMREEQISTIAAKLTLRYHQAMFLPITQSYRMRQLNDALGTSFASWKDIDLAAIEHCDQIWVVMMPGWKDSVGVQQEIKWAKYSKIPIKYINCDTLQFVKPKGAAA